MSNRVHSTLGVILAIAIPTLAAAQSPSVSDPDLTSEVRSLRQSMEGLVSILDRAIANQTMEVLLRRLDQRERRVIPLEAELRKAREELHDHEQFVGELERKMEELQPRLSDAALMDDEEALESSHAERVETEDSLRYSRSRVEFLRGRVRDLEDDLSDFRKHIRRLEAAIDDHISALLE